MSKVFYTRATHDKRCELKWLVHHSKQNLIHNVNISLPVTVLDFCNFFKGAVKAFQAVDVWRGGNASPSCCLVDGRKEEDELSLQRSTESFCVTLFGVAKEKSGRIVPLTTVTVKRRASLKCPHWMPPKRLKHIKMATCVHGPSLVAKALFKIPTTFFFFLFFFLNCHGYASVCG